MTMPDTNPELDVEDFVITYLTEQGILPAGQIAGRMPPQLNTPFVLVQRVAGGDDYIVDSATISVHSFANVQTDASTIARTVHHAMRQLHPATVITVDGNNWNIYRYTTEQTPIFMEWEPSGGGTVMSRYVARYRIDVRLPSIRGY
jgi:hypothetical protein